MYFRQRTRKNESSLLNIQLQKTTLNDTKLCETDFPKGCVLVKFKFLKY